MADNNRDRRRSSEPVRRPVQRRRRKRKKNILPVIILGIVGVVIIALIIMGLKTIFSGPKDKSVSESEIVAEVSSVSGAEDSASSEKPSDSATPAPTPAKETDISGLDVYSDIDIMVVVGDSAYEYYKYNNDVATNYIKNINSAYDALGGSANMYEMIIPSSIDIMLPLSFLNNYVDQSSDQNKATNYIYSSLNSGIKTVPLYDVFKAHCDEKLYFSTDNHWTGLAAYYAYSQWAYTKGIDILPKDGFDAGASDNFTGWDYLYSGLDRLNYGETVDYYKPKANMSYEYSDNNDGSELTEGELFPAISDDNPNEKFSTFLGGSHSLSIITNDSVKDESACVLVVDSNGMALAPFVATAYNKTYIVDYRTYSGSVSQLAKDNKAQDVIWCTSIACTASEELTASIAAVK